MSRDSLPVIKVDELPSRFLPYPDGTVIRYYPYTFGEIKKLSQMQGNPAEVFRVILGGIETEGVESSDITLSDFLFIALLRKLSSLGSSTFTLTLPCGNCFESVTKSFTTDQLEFSDLEVPALPVTLTLGAADTELQFKPLTIGGFLKLSNANALDDELALLAAEVVNLDYDAARSVIENSTGEDLELLSQVDEYLFHDVKPLDVECPTCKHVTHQTLKGREDLIRPFRPNDDAVRNRIRFGV